MQNSERQISQGIQQSPMSYSQQLYQPQVQQSQQQVKFYRSGLFGLSSAVGRFQRDVPKMARDGWKVVNFAHLGTNFWLRRTIGVTYEK